MQLERAVSYSNFLIPYFLLLPKLLLTVCAWKQWYQARVYDLATEMARWLFKTVSYTIFYCTQEYSVLLLLCTLPRYLLSKVNAGVSGQTFVYLLKIALYLYEYVTT